MPKCQLIRKARFSAAHRLHSKNLSDQENQDLFGKCNLPNGHGHNYLVEVKVEGEIHPETGIVMDLSILKTLLEQTVMAKMDHRNLNLDVKEFKDLNPTAENIALVIWNWISVKIPSHLKLEVELHETDNNSVIYKGA